MRQSIFLARIDLYNDGITSPSGEFSEVGCSCLPILLAMVLGLVLLATTLGLAREKFPSTIPMAGSCSVAIAAAAHGPKGDVGTAYLPVRLGEIIRGEGKANEVGHCCFANEEVGELVVGCWQEEVRRKWAPRW